MYYEFFGKIIQYKIKMPFLRDEDFCDNAVYSGNMNTYLIMMMKYILPALE